MPDNDPRVTKKWPVWRTIQLGNGPRDADDFRRLSSQKRLYVSDLATDMLRQPTFTVASRPMTVDLAVVNGKWLGFHEAVVREELYAKVQQLGLDLPPSEAGPQLRLQYEDQPLGPTDDLRAQPVSWLLVGMNPIRGTDGNRRIFSVEHFNRMPDRLDLRKGHFNLPPVESMGMDRWLEACDDGPAGLWDPLNCWVFVVPPGSRQQQ